MMFEIFTQIAVGNIVLLPKKNVVVFCHEDEDTNLWYATHPILGHMAASVCRKRLLSLAQINLVKHWLSRSSKLFTARRNDLMSHENKVKSYLANNFVRQR